MTQEEVEKFFADYSKLEQQALSAGQEYLKRLGHHRYGDFHEAGVDLGQYKEFSRYWISSSHDDVNIPVKCLWDIEGAIADESVKMAQEKLQNEKQEKIRSEQIEKEEKEQYLKLKEKYEEKL